MAEAVSGDVASFVELMNTRAAELGMEDTHFSNTHGYHDDDHHRPTTSTSCAGRP